MKFSGPRLYVHLEGLVVLFVAVAGYREWGGSWALFAGLFLVPDLFMLGYLFGVKVGARIYNAGHTYAAPFLLGLVVYWANRPELFSLCLIWVAHIGFDRLLGYGLKYDTAFKDTHLQRL